jgi:hypothetical protein
MVQAVRHLLYTILAVASAFASLAPSAIRSRAQLAAENLFLRKQLALYQERKVKPRRADDATRIILAGLSRFLTWHQLLLIVKPETLIRGIDTDSDCSGAGSHVRPAGLRFRRTCSG